MATRIAYGFPTNQSLPNSARIAAAQAGNGSTTDIVDRGLATGPALVSITTTVGATPTCTYLIEGSADGATWVPAAIADPATPETASVATFAITTAGTTNKLVRPGHPWRFLRITFSANTNVTNTVDVFPF